jgi:hypothetical protein
MKRCHRFIYTCIHAIEILIVIPGHCWKNEKELIWGRSAFGSSGLERLAPQLAANPFFFSGAWQNRSWRRGPRLGGAGAELTYLSRIYSVVGNYARFVSASRSTPTCQNPHVSKWSCRFGVAIASAQCIFNMHLQPSGSYRFELKKREVETPSATGPQTH